MKYFNSLSVYLLALVLVALSPVHAQIVGGSISGTVRDTSGAAVTGATVTVHQIETGATRILATNADGRFYAPSVPVGNYVVSVVHDDFQTDQRSGISLAIGQSIDLAFVLGVAKAVSYTHLDVYKRQVCGSPRRNVSSTG